METGTLRRDLEHLIGLYEHRIVKFLKMMDDTVGKFKKDSESYRDDLIRIEQKLRDHEIRRREFLKLEAGMMMETVLHVTEIPPEYINKNVVNIRFDAAKTFEELQIKLSEHRNGLLSRFNPFATKIRDDEAERLYGMICAWASADFVKGLSKINEDRINKETDARISQYRERMYRHYEAVSEQLHFAIEKVLLGMEDSDVQRLISSFESVNREYDIINRSDIVFGYELEAVDNGIKAHFKSDTGTIKFIAVSDIADIVPMFPYHIDEFRGIFEDSFGSCIVSDNKYVLSWKDRENGCRGLQYIYPIKAFGCNVVVYPPRKIEDFLWEKFPEAHSDVLDYTIEDSVLTVRGFGGYRFSDVIFAVDQDNTITDIRELDNNHDMSAELYKTDPDSVALEVPLGRGVHNISLIGIMSEGTRAFHITDVYSGNKISVKYTVEYRRKTGDIEVRFLIDPDSGFEEFRQKKLPGIVVCAGEPAPLTKDDGRVVYETDSVVFRAEERGCYRAILQASVDGIDPRYDEFSVFFKKQSKIYQLTKTVK